MPRKKKEEQAPVEAKAEVKVEAPIAVAAAPVVDAKEEKLQADKTQFSRERIEAVTHYVYKQVASIVFGVLSPKMIKKMASAKIVTPELYDKEGYPVDGGLMDVRLGVIDPGLRCKTCSSKLKECIGHFGYIELARPVVHVKFVRIIQLLLKATCKECSRLMISQEKWTKAKSHLERIEREEGPEARRLAVKALIEGAKSGGKCPHCKAKQAKVAIEKPTTFIEGDRRISPIEVRARLEKIPDEDVELFGLNPKTARPE